MGTVCILNRRRTFVLTANASAHGMTAQPATWSALQRGALQGTTACGREHGMWIRRFGPVCLRRSRNNRLFVATGQRSFGVGQRSLSKVLFLALLLSGVMFARLEERRASSSAFSDRAMFGHSEVRTVLSCFSLCVRTVSCNWSRKTRQVQISDCVSGFCSCITQICRDGRVVT